MSNAISRLRLIAIEINTTELLEAPIANLEPGCECLKVLVKCDKDCGVLHAGERDKQIR